MIGEHLSQLGDVFVEFYRVISPGGRLVFSVYHPDMSAAGIEANFERAGIEYRLGAIHYSVSDHLRLLQEAGFERPDFHEFSGDQELIKTVPSAAKYLGSLVLLVLSAHKF